LDPSNVPAGYHLHEDGQLHADAAEGCDELVLRSHRLRPPGAASSQCARSEAWQRRNRPLARLTPPRQRPADERTESPPPRREPTRTRIRSRKPWHRCATTNGPQTDQAGRSQRGGRRNPREPLQSRDTQGRVRRSSWGSSPLRARLNWPNYRDFFSRTERSLPRAPSIRTMRSTGSRSPELSACAVGPALAKLRSVLG